MPRPIGELLPEVLAHATERHRRLLDIQRRWTKAVGKETATHTRVVAFRRGALYVQADDSGSSYMLHLEAPRILKRLNAGRPDERVQSFVIRAGDVAAH